MKLDPRTKMVMVLCLSGLALLYNTPGRLLLLLAVTVAILLLFRFDLGAIGSYLKPFLSLMVFLFVIQCLFATGLL
jgi:energy-coupling factor transport system permease protein